MFVAMSVNPADTADSRLVFISKQPFNAELPLPLQHGVITPNSLHYVRSHFAAPSLTLDSWRLQVDGAVGRALTLDFAALSQLPSRTLTITMECAGNGRTSFQPPADGEPWQYGAVSTAEWTGVSLRDVLALVEPKSSAREVLIQGADSGHVGAVGKTLTYERSMTVEQAQNPDVLLAYAMNGEALPVEHGFPVRLIVSGWYGMASVKWVRTIRVLEQPFSGFYQVDRYIMAHPERGETTKTPLTAIEVRAQLTSHQDGAVIAAGSQMLRGLAWSGHAPISQVEVSVDGGASWTTASLVTPATPYAWRRWEYLWNATPGTYSVQVRGTDSSGRVQPLEADWNKLGYSNNGVTTATISVR